jgi:hypothetical protein
VKVEKPSLAKSKYVYRVIVFPRSVATTVVIAPSKDAEALLYALSLAMIPPHAFAFIRKIHPLFRGGLSI